MRTWGRGWDTATWGPWTTLGLVLLVELLLELLLPLRLLLPSWVSVAALRLGLAWRSAAGARLRVGAAAECSCSEGVLDGSAV